jgi:periplasmic divalent cation tolerance protein
LVPPSPASVIIPRRRAARQKPRPSQCLPGGARGVRSDAMSGDDEPAEAGLSQVSGRFLQVQTTTDSRAEAVELARGAVQARLAACAQVSGPVASTYWWEGTLERAEEWLLTLKLPTSGYQALADFIVRSHSYDEPEIVATPIVAGSEGFLSWIEEETLRP